MKTKNQHAIPTAKAAVIALAEIKDAAQAFDRSEANVFDALDDHRRSGRGVPSGRVSQADKGSEA